MGGEKIQEQFSNKLIKKWTDQINRVGMIQPSAEFYSFIRHIELAARDIFIENLEVNLIIWTF